MTRPLFGMVAAAGLAFGIAPDAHAQFSLSVGNAFTGQGFSVGSNPYGYGGLGDGGLNSGFSGYGSGYSGYSGGLNPGFNGYSSGYSGLGVTPGYGYGYGAQSYGVPAYGNAYGYGVRRFNPGYRPRFRRGYGYGYGYGVRGPGRFGY